MRKLLSRNGLPASFAPPKAQGIHGGMQQEKIGHAAVTLQQITDGVCMGMGIKKKRLR